MMSSSCECVADLQDSCWELLANYDTTDHMDTTSFVGGDVVVVEGGRRRRRRWRDGCHFIGEMLVEENKSYEEMDEEEEKSYEEMDEEEEEEEEERKTWAVFDMWDYADELEEEYEHKYCASHNNKKSRGKERKEKRIVIRKRRKNGVILMRRGNRRVVKEQKISGSVVKLVESLCIVNRREPCDYVCLKPTKMRDLNKMKTMDEIRARCRSNQRELAEAERQRKYALTSGASAAKRYETELANFLVQLQERDITPEDYERLLQLDASISPPTLPTSFVLGLQCGEIGVSDEDVGAALLKLEYRDVTPEDYDLLLCLDESLPPTTNLPGDRLVDDGKDYIELIDECSGLPTCAICWEQYRHGQLQRILPCGHSFHAYCVDTWLTLHSVNCPLDGLSVL